MKFVEDADVVVVVMVAPILVKTLYIKVVTKVTPKIELRLVPTLTSDCLLTLQEIGQMTLPSMNSNEQHSPVRLLHKIGPIQLSSPTMETAPRPILHIVKIFSCSGVDFSFFESST